MIGNYAFLQGIYVPTFGSNGPLWSLANEFWYYIAFPFLVCALWPRLSAAQRLLNVLLLIAILAFVHPQIALMGLIWLMGVAIHYLPPLPIGIPFVLRWSIPRRCAGVRCHADLVQRNALRGGHALCAIGLILF
jgi:peptidoglycan/LPS O-acetylase OafA/YrhL